MAPTAPLPSAPQGHDERAGLAGRLARVNRRSQLRAFLLVAPLLAFILVTFVFPIADLLLRSAYDPLLRDLLPRSYAALGAWDGKDLPPEEAYAALVADMKERRADQTIGKAASRFNMQAGGGYSLMMSTARRAARMDAAPFKAALVAADPLWGERKTWADLSQAMRVVSPLWYLRAVDLTLDVDGGVARVEADQRVHLLILGRTLWISLLVTVACLLLGFPLAHLLATLPARTSNVLMILVLLPFWTSLLVRITAWIVLLQKEGVLNDILVFAGILAPDGRVQLVYNQAGTLIAMTHILLPYMVLSIYSVMKTISPSYMRAAQSLGASPTMAFLRVYLPQTIPGVGAGCLLVFILAIGYYITPALVGGATGQMISNIVEFHFRSSLNWGLAAAIAGLLLACVLALYWVFNRLVGIQKLKLG